MGTGQFSETWAPRRQSSASVCRRQAATITRRCLGDGTILPHLLAAWDHSSLSFGETGLPGLSG
jgi:hypothetical protein